MNNHFFWSRVEGVFGHDLTMEINKYVQWIMIGLICAAIVTWALFMLANAIRVWMCDNEEHKKQLKLARVKMIHAFMYIVAGLLFIELFWNVFLPGILEFAGLGTNKS